jgi:hypothetical protein
MSKGKLCFKLVTYFTLAGMSPPAGGHTLECGLGPRALQLRRHQIE